MGHVPSDPPRVPSREHGNFLSLNFRIYFCIWVGVSVSYLLYLFCICKGHKHSGLFLTNLPFLWFPTLAIISLKLVIFLKLVKTICKASYNNYINAQMCYFCCIFRALWLITSWATGAPPTFYSIRWV